MSDLLLIVALLIWVSAVIAFSMLAMYYTGKRDAYAEVIQLMNDDRYALQHVMTALDDEH